jgi:hypothetical protein
MGDTSACFYFVMEKQPPCRGSVEMRARKALTDGKALERR